MAMKLSQALSIYPQLKWGDEPHREVSAITADSREVSASTIFVAIRGHRQDGHQFLKKVCDAGAAGVVVESASEIPPTFKGAVVVVKNTRDALDRLAAHFFGNPADKL